jgi:hypothetical protein
MKRCLILKKEKVKWETDREQNSLGRGAGYGSNIQFTKKLYNNDKTI